MSIFGDAPPRAWANAFLQGIPYARESGMVADDLGHAKATVSMPARDAWTGDAARQQLHPGCLTVLADTACGLAVGAAMNPIEPFATLDLRMDYLRPARAGLGLICVAHCHRLSRSVAFVRGELFQPGVDDAVATVNATFMLGTANQRRTDMATARAAAQLPAGQVAMPAAALPVPRPVASGAQAEPWAAPTDPCEPALPAGVSPYVDFLALRRLPSSDPRLGDLFQMPFHPHLIGNPVLPALHGGVVAGFAESAAVLHLAFSNGITSGPGPRGVDFAIDYLRSAKPVDTWARCTTVRQGSRVALVQVNVWQDDPTRPIVSARSHCLLPKEG